MNRTEFSAKTKDLAYQRSQGKCEGCGLPLKKGWIVYDHRDPDWMGGDNSLSNCACLGWCCSKTKDAKDAKNRAKVKRIQRKEHGIRKPRTIRAWRNMRGEIVIAPRDR